MNSGSESSIPSLRNAGDSEYKFTCIYCTQTVTADIAAAKTVMCLSCGRYYYLNVTKDTLNIEPVP